MTRQQIADALGVSRSLVWQIEQSALAKIRDGLQRDGFDPETELPDTKPANP